MTDPSSPTPAVLKLSPGGRLAALAGGALLLGMLAVLIAVLASLEGTRSELRTTREGVTAADKRFQRVTLRLQPLLDATAPLADPAAQQEVRNTGKSVAQAADRVPGLADDAQRGAGAAYFIAQVLQGSDLFRTFGALRSLATTALPVADVLERQLSGNGRPTSLAGCDAQLSARPPADAGQLACLLRTVPNIRRLLRSQRDITRSSLTTQGKTLGVTRDVRELLVQSLSVQQEILRRARSLDQKTGGPAPGTVAP